MAKGKWASFNIEATTSEARCRNELLPQLRARSYRSIQSIVNSDDCSPIADSYSSSSESTPLLDELSSIVFASTMRVPTSQ